jgi:hypothetical protein
MEHCASRHSGVPVEGITPANTTFKTEYWESGHPQLQWLQRQSTPYMEALLPEYAMVDFVARTENLQAHLEAALIAAGASPHALSFCAKHAQT